MSKSSGRSPAEFGLQDLNLFCIALQLDLKLFRFHRPTGREHVVGNCVLWQYIARP